ncbi:hypothetical protein F4782DRAFT_517988 [Xylaria castorea]|nr:hypothetical protein F4782DRAFT_517988 [Xylaria castorea]
MPGNALPENTSNWKIPLSYSTTLLLAAASLALSTIISKLPKEKVAQFMASKDNVAQVPAPKESATQVIAPKDSVSKVAAPLALESDVVEVSPEEDDINQLSQKTREAVSRYTTAALSRYTTKSRTVVSTSRISHDQASSSHTSSQVEIESTNTTPEELDL